MPAPTMSLKCQVSDLHVGPIGFRHAIETRHFGRRIVSCQKAQSAGNFDGVPRDLGFRIGPAADSERGMALRFELSFHCREFHGLRLENGFGEKVAADRLQDRRHCAHGHGEQERRTSVCIPIATQRRQAYQPATAKATAM